MIWLAILLLAFAIFAGIYCSTLYNTLYRNGIVKESGLRQTRSGNKDSGIWSSPLALLLIGNCIRRFKKLEKRSPDIAAPPISAPILYPSPTNRAPIAVTSTERSTPRTVFDAPNKA